MSAVFIASVEFDVVAPGRRARPSHRVEEIVDRLGERQPPEDLVDGVRTARSFAKEDAARAQLEANGRPGDETELLADGGRQGDLAFRRHRAFHE
jgi:hypothetical protein